MVCVLIGAISSLAIANLFVDHDNIARSEARKLAKIIGELREESLLSGRQMAIELDHAKDDDRYGYHFLIYQGQWQAVEDGVFSAQSFADEINVSWQVEGKKSNIIVAEPIGLISDFKIVLAGNKQRYEVRVNDELKVIVEERGKDD